MWKRFSPGSFIQPNPAVEQRFVVVVFDEVCRKKEMWSFFARDPVKDFAYEILPDTQEKSGIWTLHRGKRKVKRRPLSNPATSLLAVLVQGPGSSRLASSYVYKGIF